MNGAETYKQLQSAARSMGAKTGKRVPTEEYLIRHAIESFLDRLTKTPHTENFVLIGLLGYAPETTIAEKVAKILDPVFSRDGRKA